MQKLISEWIVCQKAKYILKFVKKKPLEEVQGQMFSREKETKPTKRRNQQKEENYEKIKKKRAR